MQYQYAALALNLEYLNPEDRLLIKNSFNIILFAIAYA